MNCPRCGHDPSARVTASWSFFVDKEVASLNAHRVNAGTRRQQAAYRRERDEWTAWMKLGRMNERIPTAKAKRRVRLERVFGARQRPYDLDNLIGGLKSCVDAMVAAGLLIGDTRDLAEIKYVQVKAGAGQKAGLRVLIEELGLAPINTLPPQLTADAIALHYQKKPRIR